MVGKVVADGATGIAAGDALAVEEDEGVVVGGSGEIGLLKRVDSGSEPVERAGAADVLLDPFAVAVVGVGVSGSRGSAAFSVVGEGVHAIIGQVAGCIPSTALGTGSGVLVEAVVVVGVEHENLFARWPTF